MLRSAFLTNSSLNDSSANSSKASSAAISSAASSKASSAAISSAANFSVSSANFISAASSISHYLQFFLDLSGSGFVLLPCVTFVNLSFSVGVAGATALVGGVRLRFALGGLSFSVFGCCWVVGVGDSFWGLRALLG